MIGSSGSGKANSLFNLMNQQSDIDKTYLCAKDPYEAKYQFVINKQETRSKKLKTRSSYWILKWFEWYLQKHWKIQPK